MSSFYGNGGGGDNTEMISTLSANFAAPYNTTSTYSNGDFVIKDGILYKANQDISIAEEWTKAHWTAVTVMSEMADNIEIAGGGDCLIFYAQKTWDSDTNDYVYTPITPIADIFAAIGSLSTDKTAVLLVKSTDEIQVFTFDYYTDMMGGFITFRRSGSNMSEQLDVYLNSASYDHFSDSSAASDTLQSLKATIAPAYDSTATYTVGALVYLGNNLYKCTTAVTTPEDMDYTKWTAVAITDELGGSGNGGDNTIIYYVTRTYDSNNQTYGYTGLPTRSDLIEAVGTASEGKNVILRIKLSESSNSFYDFRLMYYNDNFSGYNIPGDIALWFETATGSHSLRMYKSGNDEIITLTQNPQKVNDDQLQGILNSLIAPSWQANTAYSVGDCVLRGMNSLYKCTEAHTSTSYFQSNKWTQTTLAAMIAAANT